MAIDEATLYVGGARVAPHSAARITVIDPATEEPYGSVPNGDDVDVDVAVEAARDAFAHSGWKETPRAERAAVLERVADALLARGERTAGIVSHENGMPLQQSMILNSIVPAGVFRSFAGMLRSLELEEVRPSGDDHALVRKVPVGVAAMITPWNYPQILLSHKLAPALAMGCAAVIKPAPETPLDAYVLLEALEEAGVPGGVVNLVTGGPDTGRHLISHRGVDKVAFTGSTAVGREIAALCGNDLRRVSLELGGKSAAILLDDVDLETLSREAVQTCLPNTDQTCYASTRVLAPRARYEETIDALVAAFEPATTGNPFEEGSVFGPLVSERQKEKVEGYLALGEREGAKAVIGGPTGERHATTGWYVPTTIFRDADNAMRIAQEEIFGPVVTVIAYDTEEEAIEIANHFQYGLGGSVFSADTEHATAVARRVATGTIGINGYLPSPVAPFGGVKASGIGRELGPEGLSQYFEYQSIYRSGPAV